MGLFEKQSRFAKPCRGTIYLSCPYKTVIKNLLFSKALLPRFLFQRASFLKQEFGLNIPPCCHVMYYGG